MMFTAQDVREILAAIEAGHVTLNEAIARLAAVPDPTEAIVTNPDDAPDAPTFDVADVALSVVEIAAIECQRLAETVRLCPGFLMPKDVARFAALAIRLGEILENSRRAATSEEQPINLELATEAELGVLAHAARITDRLRGASAVPPSLSARTV